MLSTTSTTTLDRACAAATDRPIVSVIIPAYKVAPFIKEALDSVLSQTFNDYEVIVINDGSPDTDELEKQVEAYSPWITYIKQPNAGAGAARNAGIRVARGEFVAFLDGDDLWLPEFLEQQLGLIRSEGGFDLVYADAFNLAGSRLTRKSNMEFNPSSGAVTARSLISAQCNVITSSVVARRASILAAGLFDETFPNSQDFDLWLRLAKQGARMNYQKKVLVHRRIYEGSLASDPVKSLRGEISVLEKTAERDDLTAEERAAILHSLERCRATVEVFKGKQLLTAGDFAASLTSFRVANRHFQSWKLRLVLLSLHIAPRLLRRIYKLRTT